MVVQIISEYTKFSALAFVVTELLPRKIKIKIQGVIGGIFNVLQLFNLTIVIIIKYNKNYLKIVNCSYSVSSIFLKTF